jgi:DNA polymerase III delta subunit
MNAEREQVPDLVQLLSDGCQMVGKGADKKDLDLLIKLCGNNIFRLNQELDKLRLFGENERKYVFQDMLRDGLLNDLSAFNIFNVITSIMSKDMPSLLSVYRELDRVDVNEFGLLTLLLKNFRNLIMVYFNSNPTPETTGLDSKVIYAIKKQPLKYNQEQIVSVFNFLCDVDRQVKSGELPADILIDYLLIKTLSS